MLAVQLKGGLGNQLFQWALARRLVAEGRNVVLDPRLLGSGSRQYAIMPLCADLRLSSKPSAGVSLSRRLKMPRTPAGYRRVVEPHYRYWPEVFSLRGRCLLEGYWQSPRYFGDLAGDIRTRVASYGEALLSQEGQDLFSRIRHDPGAVSVHVRRTDYITDPRAAGRIGFVGARYYDLALAEMQARGGSTYYLFSDDLPWVERHLRGVDMHVVPRTATVAAGGELALMAACQGHIVANSSFSWWGAWLNPGASLGVIAPQPWFRDESIATDDLVPVTWHRMSRGDAPSDEAASA